MKSFIFTFLVVALFGLTIAAQIPKSGDDLSKDQLINRARNLIHEGRNALSNHKHTEKNHKTVEEIYEIIGQLKMVIHRLEHQLNETTLEREENFVNNFERRLHELIRNL
ncbi:uncharacterized protein LOC142597448 [Dermatophagoides farinae]|uniref:uncharacterized protein LOC142597448 n=1 Tax=Dermatophagoides farinae TaxID=6954 RepID=UPI003F5FEC0F